MDVKLSFLNNVVEEENYIEYIEGFETYDWESHVCILGNHSMVSNRNLEHGILG